MRTSKLLTATLYEFTKVMSLAEELIRNQSKTLVKRVLDSQGAFRRQFVHNLGQHPGRTALRHVRRNPQLFRNLVRLTTSVKEINKT